ncbi:MAG: hypothetical protein ACMUEK_01015 [Sodalis sp. (in: enterobacteria)]
MDCSLIGKGTRFGNKYQVMFYYKNSVSSNRKRVTKQYSLSQAITVKLMGFP